MYRGQGETDRPCILAGSGLHAQVLHECDASPLERHSSTKRRLLVLAFWVGQDGDVVEYVHSCQTCQG